MRRQVLLTPLALLATGPLAASPAAPSRTDKRLLGTWRSDKDRTLKLWRYTKQVDAEARAKFEAIFGKMTWRITPHRWESQFEDQKFSGRYTVLAGDERSVIVSYRYASNQPAELKQCFVEDDWLYVVVGYNFEFFKRVEA